jgi:hypothetical protein
MIAADQHTVAEVLGDGFIHEIPPYQRPYAWTSDEALQLLDDLLGASEASDSEPYFLGSIVLIRPQHQKVGQVVDGQQRLTTLSILAAVLRDVADNDQEKVALAGAVYIEPNPFKAQVEAVRLRAHTEDQVFFKEAVLLPGRTAQAMPPHQPTTDAQSLMWGNAQALRTQILGLPTLARQRLVTFLLNSAVLVVVSTDSRTTALRIFRVLNDRGLDLTNADVIKADLLEHFSDPAEIAHQAARWRELESDLGRDNFENLLEVIRFIWERAKNRRALSDAYYQRFKSASAAHVREFLDSELAPAKSWLSAIIDGSVDAFPETLRERASEALIGLQLVPNKDWMPVAVAAAIAFGADERCVETFERLEGLAWTLQLARRYDTQRMNRYAEVLIALVGGLEKARDKLRPTSDEAQDAWQALAGPIYNRFPVRVVRALLERLDRLLAEQPVMWSGLKTVEHILPQNPKAEDWGQFSDQQRGEITHTLGNLVLLTARKNSGASNLPFAAKVKTYFSPAASGNNKKRATYASVQELASMASWTMNDYSARHIRHATLLAERWGILPPKAEPAKIGG